MADHEHRIPTTLKEMMEWIQSLQVGILYRMEWKFSNRFDEQESCYTKYGKDGIISLFYAIEKLRKTLLVKPSDTGDFKPCETLKCYYEFEDTLCKIIAPLTSALAFLKWVVEDNHENAVCMVTQTYLLEKGQSGIQLGEGFKRTDLKTFTKHEIETAVKHALMSAEALLPYCFAIRPWKPATAGDAFGWFHGFLTVLAGDECSGEKYDGIDVDLDSKIAEKFGGGTYSIAGDLSDISAILFYLHGMVNSTKLMEFIRPTCQKAYDEKCFVKNHYDVYISDLKDVATTFIDGFWGLLGEDSGGNFRYWTLENISGATCMYKNGFTPVSKENKYSDVLKELNTSLGIMKTPGVGKKELQSKLEKVTVTTDPRSNWPKNDDRLPPYRKQVATIKKNARRTIPSSTRYVPRLPMSYDIERKVVEPRKERDFSWFNSLLLGGLVGTTACVVLGGGIYLMKSHSATTTLQGATTMP